MIEDARLILDEIDLDPASCAFANEQYVLAETYFDRASNGLEQPWFGDVFLNPPGTCGGIDCGWKRGCGCRLVSQFWVKAVRAWAAGEIDSLFWVGFSLEQLQNLQVPDRALPRDFPIPQMFPTCFPRGRLRFADQLGEVDPHPTHSNYLTLLPRDVEQARDFARVMRRHGWVSMPAAGVFSRSERSSIFDLACSEQC